MKNCKRDDDAAGLLKRGEENKIKYHSFSTVVDRLMRVVLSKTFPTYPRFRGGREHRYTSMKLITALEGLQKKKIHTSVTSFSHFLLRLPTSLGCIELHHSVLPRLIHDSRHEASHVRSHLKQAWSHQLETQRAVLAAGRIGCDKRMARPHISAILLVARASWVKHTVKTSHCSDAARLIPRWDSIGLKSPFSWANLSCISI